MTEEYLATNTRIGRMRNFSISSEGRVVFDLKYAAIDRDWDPTFDLMDLEMEDFFVYVTLLWGDEEGKSRLLRSWAPSPGGVTPV
jgi:hypothetical protein